MLPDALNQEHHLVIVASELDNSTERIVLYLSGEFSVPVSMLFFRYYLDGDREYLARTRLNAPASADVATAKLGKAKTREPWNGQDFYVTCGEGPHRNWDDEIRYGYISWAEVRNTRVRSTSYLSAAGFSSTYQEPGMSALVQ